MQVDFYQLAGSPVDRVLAQIAAKVIDGGGRLLVVTGDDAQARTLDDALWLGVDGFLPHGIATVDDDGADQPVLIAGECAPANHARNVALVDGRWREDALDFERAFHFFDAATVDAARAAWRALAHEEDVTRNFWSQDEAGRWRKTA